MSQKNKSNREKLIHRSSITLGILGAIYVVLNLIPIHSVDVKPFYQNLDRPLVIAHQGGEHLAPSSTMPAFQNAVNLGVDVLETDIHISKDGHLVAIHDDTVNRTTDGTGAVNDLTLDELKELDAGYYFEKDGEHPYRGQGIELVTVEELFEKFPDQRFLIEIKDTNPYERMDEISKRLNELIETHQLVDQVTIASFDHNIIETFKKHANPDIAVSGGEQEVRKFVITHKFHLKNLYKPSVDSMQLPLEASGYDLTTYDLLDSAERMGLQIHYWTINDQDDMETLINRGAHGIVTDRPDLMLELLDEEE
ncbi:glycerophosphodiester phosphodiesterase [Aquisalibacillus elongatus]|uniref:Glycerophosphoryl diester phosphodiesterase n=1 Tax=Aquisalibacillus elongatus TaxID=485577 RepID=A0A3N5BGB9_9BACI|nr:glycerophosphodiester phosphodiesterase [Aquisalibacillus elongatus]RPF55839.1 glycerophosphoryl diester phosphodiesterase [Aquisalibacillus elongatus]